MNELDKIDIQLLKALQENARTSIKELASQVYLSSPATASRISRMEEKANWGIQSKQSLIFKRIEKAEKVCFLLSIGARMLQNALLFREYIP